VAKRKTIKSESIGYRFRELISRESIFPIVLLFICFLGFGLLFASLGFYWDDWTIVFVKKSGGLPGLIDFYKYDRPISVWIHALSGYLLGATPALWHLYFVVVRWLTALALWAVLKQVWPKQKVTLAAAALLFAVYPTFVQQPIAVTYSALFIDFAIFFCSIWAMLKAVNEPKRYWSWTALALFFCVVHLTSEEYFSGLELTRPILLFLVLRQKAKPISQGVKRVARHWIPYLTVLIGFVIWRMFFLTVLEDPNQITLFSSLVSNPIATLIATTQNALRYFLHVVVTGWYPALQPDLINFSDRGLLFSIFVAIAAGLFSFAVLVNWRRKTKADKKASGNWPRQALVVGVLVVMCGMLPVLATERDLFAGLYADRLTIPAMFGAALIWVGMSHLTLKDAVHRAIVIAVLIGLAAGLHVRTANTFRRDWEKQSRIYWQTIWRTGELEPNTPIISTGALSGYVSEYSASAAINMLYRSPLKNGQVDYWYFDLYDDFSETLEDLPGGIPVSAFHRGLHFNGSSADAIYMHYSSNAQCVWFLNANDVDNVQVPEDMRNQIEQSDLRPVNPGIQDNYLPDPATFGPEPDHTWCYYFQKIDLARERKQPEEVLDLWAEAQGNDLGPNNQYELMPVINAYIESDQIETALDLSLEVYRRQPDTQQMLCIIWGRWKSSGGATPELLGLGENLFERLACP
jgi:hypothetical protein